MRLNQHDEAGGFIRSVTTPLSEVIGGRHMRFPLTPDIDLVKSFGFYSVTDPEAPIYDPRTERLEYSEYTLVEGVSTRTVTTIDLDLETAKANYTAAIRAAYEQRKTEPITTSEATGSVPLNIAEKNQSDWIKGERYTGRNPNIPGLKIRGADKVSRDVTPAMYGQIFDELSVIIATLDITLWALEDVVISAITIEELKAIIIEF